jgi:hypothetical protein
MEVDVIQDIKFFSGHASTFSFLLSGRTLRWNSFVLSKPVCGAFYHVLSIWRDSLSFQAKSTKFLTDFEHFALIFLFCKADMDECSCFLVIAIIFMDKSKKFIILSQRRKKPFD